MKEVKSIMEFDNGSILDRVQHELSKVMENIADINTDTKPRTLTIKFTLTPDEKRRFVDIKADVTKGNRPTHSIKTAMQLSMSKEEIVATELTAQLDGQISLDGEVMETKCLKFEKVGK